MSSPVEVVIPLRTNGCPHREAAFQFCRQRYTYPLTIAPGGEPWIKAEALWPAVQASEAEILVVADADVVTDGIEKAVQAVQQGAPWAIPHRDVYRLTEEGTARYIAGEPLKGLPLAQRPYWGIEGGGILVIPRETLLAVPMDPHFTGWGQEDSSHGIALHHQLGPCWRGNAPLVHLFHPPAPRLNRKKGSAEGWARYRRYCGARRSDADMKALLEEARAALDVHHPPGDHHHADGHRDEGSVRQQPA